MKIFSIFASLFIACTTDNRLHSIVEKEREFNFIEDTPEVFEEDTVIQEDTMTQEPQDEPDIEIEYTPDGEQSLKPGCESTGTFIIKNVGTADLIINSIDAFATVPADIRIISNYIPMPLTLSSGVSHEVEFKITQSDNIDDTIMIVVKSNDPDEAVSTLDATYSSLPGDIHVEEFEIKENKEADILMVVDNSCSMGEEQIELAANAQLFVDELMISGIDYRIAVITTDNPRFVGPVITPSSVDPALELEGQVNVGTYGSPYETGIQESINALTPPGMASAGGTFLRSTARLSIVWISDEDDSSYGTTYTWSSDIWSKKSSPGDVSVWGIIGDPTYGCLTAAPGDRFYDLISAMGGNWTSICSTDWGIPLAGVAGSIGIDSKLELSGDPIPTSIRVYVYGVESFDWAYVVSENAISFNPGHIPPVGARIVVSYQVYDNCD